MRALLIVALCSGYLAGLANADTYLVLPLFNVSKTPNLDWIGESVAETVREGLSSEGQMALDRDTRVEAYRRLSIRPYTQLTKASIVKIGQTVDAEQVVYGQFELKPPSDPQARTRGSLRITASILDLRRMKQGPEFTEIGALEDLAALQGRLAWRVLQSIQPQHAPTETEFRQRHPLVRVNAIENYIRGLLATNVDEEHRLFTQAVRLDSHYSQPCFQLGRLLWKRKEYKAAGEWFQKVAPEDAHYHEATFFRGLCLYHTGEFADAAAAFQAVARLVPLSEVYNNLGAAQSRANVPEAFDNFRKALEGDATDPVYQFNVGYLLWKQGKFEDAAEKFHAVLDHDPQDAQATLLLSRCEKQTGARPGDPRTEGLERLKTNFEETAYWQLKAVLQSDKP